MPVRRPEAFNTLPNVFPAREALRTANCSRILDLDLDFFLDDVAFNCDDEGPRLSGDEYHPWNEHAVRRFLEGNCGLSRSNRIPGRQVIHHEEAFFWWRELVRTDRISLPFEVVHVDAHSDLGGGGGFIYLMQELLHLPIEKRTEPRVGPFGMDAGNYLIFAAACRWLAEVTYVPNPRSRDDLLRLYFKNFDITSGAIQLKRAKPQRFNFVDDLYAGVATYEPEPDIPFGLVTGDFQNEVPFTHLMLCQSPGFTPPASDALMDVIGEYFQPS